MESNKNGLSNNYHIHFNSLVNPNSLQRRPAQLDHQSARPQQLSSLSSHPNDSVNNTRPGNPHSVLSASRKLYKFDFSKANLGVKADTSIQREIRLFDGSNCDEVPELRKHQVRPPYTVLQPTFDWHMVKSKIIPANPERTKEFEKEIERFLFKKLRLISPTVTEQSKLGTFASKMSGVLEHLKVPGVIDVCRIHCIDQIGSYFMGTNLIGSKTAEFVLTLKTFPLKISISALGNKIQSELQKLDLSKPYSVTFNEPETNLEVNSTSDKLKILVHFTVVKEIFAKLENRGNINKSRIIKNLVAVKQAKWFADETHSNSNITNLVRLMTDVCARFSDLHHLTPWMIIVLSHYSITQTEQKTNVLSLGAAFIRIFQLLSAGIFLPASTAIFDPVNHNRKMPINGRLSIQTQERITITAQTLFRVLPQPKGINYILGLEQSPTNVTDVFNDFSAWSNGVILEPSKAVFELKQEGDEEEDEYSSSMVIEDLLGD